MSFSQQTILILAQVSSFSLTFSTSTGNFLSVEANELRKQINNGLGLPQFLFNLKRQESRL